ncbi:MAG: DUF5112 domain-containing protein [Prevotella sp.]|nr:DUF5112 domain-containing protein [Prevotella sp.]
MSVIRNLYFFLIATLALACSSAPHQNVDELNDLSYAFHYRQLDSVSVYAQRALKQCKPSDDGYAEACNNMAFVATMRMDYDGAGRYLDDAISHTDNQIELLVAYIQQMRLCQRMSRNREFYEYLERAHSALRRINEERDYLTERLQRRMIYAESELAIVTSTYYYYVGLERQSAAALQSVDPDGDIQHDIPQYLNYLYNVGAGGIIAGGTQEEVNQAEFDHLMRCYLMARQYNYPYFAANSLEAISEHLLVASFREQLIADNLPAMKFLNPENVEPELLPTWLAYNALTIFTEYGDIYQIAGAYRTLASCCHANGDDEGALAYLEQALENPKINLAPDLVASIREQLSVAYAAINDKPSSDYNRNLYLDLQEQTRQDRELEARAAMYEKTSKQLNWMILAVVAAILLLSFMLWLFNHWHQKRKSDTSLEQLLLPLRKWQETNEREADEMRERMEEISEATALNQMHIRNNERRHLEQRAKLSLVNSITPFIDRIIHEVKRLDRPEQRAERYEYIRELTDKINEYNDVLTHWIQLRQGELSLHIESFRLQPLFDIVGKSKAGFRMKGIHFDIQPTDAVVKADRVLTLFMLNTLADNARKFTAAGGEVSISAADTPEYVEISVADTGRGMSSDELANVFKRKMLNDKSSGFGLLNCRGIIEKYRKISQIFNVCLLQAESEQGRGSRFYFRLPKGIVRLLLLLLMIPLSSRADHLSQAYIYADSAYFSNINGTYERTLQFADSCRYYLNQHYLQHVPKGRLLMQRQGDPSLPAPEIEWYHDSIETNYQTILDIRNESAVAALALHQWELYQYNNKVYTQLFKEMSADNTLADYCRVMQQSQTNKTIAVSLLVLLLVMILPAYYLLYYRHRLYYRFCVERIGKINEVLLSDATATDKLQQIDQMPSGQYPAELQHIVLRIRQALSDAAVLHSQQATHLELAEDELKRAELEDSNLHVSNAILDNCLSTLKHETMYYPSRIRQLLDEPSDQRQALTEVVDYYRDIYSILSQQAMRQTERVALRLAPVTLCNHTVLGDANLLHYLFELLTKQPDQISVEVRDEQYLVYSVPMPQLQLSAEQASQLFTPHTDHIPFLLCRQIVRDHGEATNRHGCGIEAEVNDTHQTIIKITLPRYGKL